MNDRALLEAAAKAAGMTTRTYNTELWCQRDNGAFAYWNPLTDDGDALRLAVKLELDVWVRAGRNFVEVRGPGGVTIEEGYKPDPYAATRRAIVRAAAMGKA